MPTPLDEHGGVHPGPFHITTYPDIKPRCILFLKVTEPEIVVDVFKTSLLNRLAMTIFCLPDDFPQEQVISYHPTLEYVRNMSTLGQQLTFVKSLLIQQNIPQIFVYSMRDIDVLHPTFWDILDTASPTHNTTFLDETGGEHTLYSIYAEDKDVPTRQTGRIAAYADPLTDRNRILDTLQHSLSRKTKQTLSEMLIGCDGFYTPLCQLATLYQTDKTPFMLRTHRHPYTPVYDLMLRPYQQKKNLVLGEIGVLNGSSIKMWRDYFPRATIHAFDIQQQCLDSVSNMPGVHTQLVDAGQSKGLRESLQKATQGGKLFDILLDDASHRLDHQLLFLRDAIDFIAPGGVLIIEDIFREIPAARFQEALDQISDKVHNAVLVRPEHPLRSSPQWENDRILFVWRA